MVGLLVLAYGWFQSGTPFFGKHPDFQPDTPVAIEVDLLSHGGVITNQVDCSKFLSILTTARYNGPVHVCPPFGFIIFKYPNGETNRIGFMMSHGWNRLDFIAKGELFSISSGRFLRVLEETGVHTK
jgi:hypothetical protein